MEELLKRRPFALIVMLLLATVVCRQDGTDSQLPTPAEDMTAMRGFRVEQVCRIPRRLGSWISMTFDPQGRIVASAQSGPFYRVTPSPLGQPNVPTEIEKLEIPLGGAHGLLYALDSLYAVLGAAMPQTGLFRVPDTDGAGDYGKPELLFGIDGENEHGPHSVVLGPDKSWLYIVAGNATQIPAGLTKSRLAWIDGTGNFAPPSYQGWVARCSPDGQQRELFAAGLRNAFDIAVSPEGELFTFDSDNEGYMGSPWYRPTSVFHLTSGADLGWRQGPDTLQASYPDNPAPVIEVGPGSPTGTVFGAGTKFPPKYRRAMFACDWSYGRIYAIHLKPAGATYTATAEIFLSGRPLPAADIRVGPDGALYFLTGGRGVQSAIYRITHSSHLAPREGLQTHDSQARALRQHLEALHDRPHPGALDTAWPYLKHPDRAIRYAARVAIEHHDEAVWARYAIEEKNQQASLDALLALARQGDPSRRSDILDVLTRRSWHNLTDLQRVHLLRVYQIVFKRMGVPGPDDKRRILDQLDGLYPHPSIMIDRELATVLFSLSAPRLFDRTIASLERTPTAMRQIHYVRLLEQLAADRWSDSQKQRLRSALEVEQIRLTAERPYRDVKDILASLLATIDATGFQPPETQSRKVVKEWSLADLLTDVTQENLSGRDLQRGRAVYRGAQCYTCHRIGRTGGTLGPNLTAVAARYSSRDVLEAIIEPNKVVADPYRTTLFFMSDGRQISGQIVDLGRREIEVRTNPLQPFESVRLKESEVEEMRLSNVSLMPAGLVNHLTRDEILDLMAYLLER